jgi:DNA-binding LytR/AlgR family response regulator
MMDKHHSSSNPYYPDVPLFLILIPFISAINYYLTYSKIDFNGFLLLTFTIDTVQGYSAWWAVRKIILLLDKKLPFQTNPRRRVIVQLITTLIVGLLIIAVLTELVSLIARGKPAPLNFYTVDLFIIGIWFFVINGVYVGLYYYNAWRSAEIRRLEENRVKTEGLLVKQGKQELRMKYDELAGFYVDGDYAVASTRLGKKFYLDQSLNEIEKNLPGNDFFRLNRQFIVRHDLIAGFKRMDNGKITVSLKPHEGFPTEVPVSRLKAAAFKQWFRPV